MDTMTRKRYIHTETQIESSLTPEWAALWGDAFKLVEDEPVDEVETPADAAPVAPARRARKTKTEDNSVGDDVTASAPNTDSSEEGN